MFDHLLITINGWMAMEAMSGLGLALAGAFLWGLVSVLFSPCHLASIPLIMGYVAGQGRLVEGREAARYALAFTLGLFATIALVGLACALLGRMLGDIGPWWTPPVGVALLWLALDMLGIARFPGGGGVMARLSLRGLPGALALGLGYGLLSGTCTFGFLAPMLALITLQGRALEGSLLILAFALGHCLPIALAGSSAALARRLVEGVCGGSLWVRRTAGVLVGLLGTYFLVSPLLGAGLD